jgi:hypothetical protein
MHKPTKQV